MSMQEIPDWVKQFVKAEPPSASDAARLEADRRVAELAARLPAPREMSQDERRAAMIGLRERIEAERKVRQG